MIFRPVTINVWGAQRTGKTSLVLALSGALADSKYYFNTPEFALVGIASADLTLLCGLDLPQPTHDGVEPPNDAQRQSEDTRLRTELLRVGASFQVIYGLGPARLANALHAINAFEKKALPVNLTRGSAQADFNSEKKWKWVCDKCSDAACEHALFTDLVR